MFLHSTKPTIIIAGAGFGGLRAALDLNNAFKNNPSLSKNYNLYLINESNYHLYVPAIYEIATTTYDDASAIKLKEAVVIPLEKIFASADLLKFHQAKITSIDAQTNKIILNDHTSLKYSYLIMALGSETNFYDIPGLKENSLILGGLNSAIKLRSAIEKKFCDVFNHQKQLRIVIGGAGVTGVELSGELTGYIKKLNKKYSAKIRPEIVLVQGGATILPEFSKKIIGLVEQRLKKLGVKIVTDEMITEASASAVKTKSGREFPYDVLVWSGGIKSNAVIESLPFERDKKGRIVVQENFCPIFKNGNKICSDIFVIGDNCCYIHHQNLPQTAQMALDQGEHMAKLILAGIKNQPLPKYQPTHNSYIIPIGGKFAVADLGFAQLKGFYIWIIKELVFLKYLASIIAWPQALAHWLRAIRLFAKND